MVARPRGQEIRRSSLRLGRGHPQAWNYWLKLQKAREGQMQRQQILLEPMSQGHAQVKLVVTELVKEIYFASKIHLKK